MSSDERIQLPEGVSDLDLFYLGEQPTIFDNEEKFNDSTLSFRKNGLNIRDEEFKRKLGKWVKNRGSKLKVLIKKHREQILENLNNPDLVMTIDKISFVMGILIIMVTEAFLLLFPSQLPTLYTVLLIPLLLLRYYLYRKSKEHYFLYDFCYYQQVLVLLQIYSFPESTVLFKINFALTNGPLAMAVILWRNSLVFHSVDKMTSSMIHLLPSVVMYSMKWQSHLLDHKFPLWEEDEMEPKPLSSAGLFNWNKIVDSSNILNFMCYPFLCYLIWQCLYLFKTEVISRKKLLNDYEIMTSLRYLQRKATYTTAYKIINRLFGPNHLLLGFVFYQGTYTILTLLPIPIFWHSMRIHSLYLSLIFIQALINGASYYFQIFATRYIEDLHKKAGKGFGDTKVNAT